MISNTSYKLVVVEEGSEKAVYGETFRKENLPEEAIEQVLNGSGFHGMRDFPKETFVTGFFADEMANTVGVPFEFEGVSYDLLLRTNIIMLFNLVYFLLSGMFIILVLIIFHSLYYL